jgi:hypothetical protein
MTETASEMFAFFISDVCKHHKCAFRNKRLRYALADACCGSRNQSDKSF